MGIRGPSQAVSTALLLLLITCGCGTSGPKASRQASRRVARDFAVAFYEIPTEEAAIRAVRRLAEPGIAAGFKDDFASDRKDRLRVISGPRPGCGPPNAAIR